MAEVSSLFIFPLRQNEVQKFNKWREEHDRVCPVADPKSRGFTGGRFQFCFRPTGIGNEIEIKCECGEQLDIAEYDIEL